MNLPRTEQEDGGDGPAILEDDALLHGSLLGADLGGIFGRRRAEEIGDVTRVTRRSHGTPGEAYVAEVAGLRLRKLCTAVGSGCLDRSMTMASRSTHEPKKVDCGAFVARNMQRKDPTKHVQQ